MEARFTWISTDSLIANVTLTNIQVKIVYTRPKGR